MNPRRRGEEGREVNDKQGRYYVSISGIEKKGFLNCPELRSYSFLHIVWRANGPWASASRRSFYQNGITIAVKGLGEGEGEERRGGRKRTPKSSNCQMVNIFATLFNVALIAGLPGG